MAICSSSSRLTLGYLALNRRRSSFILSLSKSWSCLRKPTFGLATFLAPRTAFSASRQLSDVTHMTYTTATVTDRDIPAKQWMRTAPPLSLAVWMKSLQAGKYCSRF